MNEKERKSAEKFVRNAPYAGFEGSLLLLHTKMLLLEDEKQILDKSYLQKAIDKIADKFIEEPDLIFKTDSQANEWKSLEVDDIPLDILTGDYEFEFKNSDNWRFWDRSRSDLFYYATGGKYMFRYRKRKPTIEDIGFKWVENNKTGCEAIVKIHMIDAYIAGYNKAKENTDELKKQYNENVLI